MPLPAGYLDGRFSPSIETQRQTPTQTMRTSASQMILTAPPYKTTGRMSRVAASRSEVRGREVGWRVDPLRSQRYLVGILFP